jgi:hypothetical protein
MNEAHVAGGAFGTLLAAILSPLLAKYGVHVTDSTASLIGVAAVAFGVGLGHVVSHQGIWPAVKRIFVGPQKPTGVTSPVAGPEAAREAPVASQAPPGA